MDWTAAERSELEHLLWHARSAPLTPIEESRLRALVAKVNPGAETLPASHLVQAGMIAYGVQVTYEILTKSARASA